MTREEGLKALLWQQQDFVEDDQELNMAEIGVWYGDVSAYLLSEFPNLRMLLVDPYHLRVEGQVEISKPRGCVENRSRVREGSCSTPCAMDVESCDCRCCGRSAARPACGGTVPNLKRSFQKPEPV